MLKASLLLALLSCGEPGTGIDLTWLPWISGTQYTCTELALDEVTDVCSGLDARELTLALNADGWTVPLRCTAVHLIGPCRCDAVYCVR